jgi:hypothetical protein
MYRWSIPPIWFTSKRNRRQWQGGRQEKFPAIAKMMAKALSVSGSIEIATVDRAGLGFRAFGHHLK